MEKFNILKIYLKNKKKSIHYTVKTYLKNKKRPITSTGRIAIFIAFSLLIFIITPIIFSGRAFGNMGNANQNKYELFLSIRSKELLGSETTETLLHKFAEMFPELQITLINDLDKNSREPDIFIFDEGEFNTLAAKGALLPLEPFMETAGSTQLAIPLVSFMDLLFFNIELLTAAGFDRPPQTRADFLLYARTVSSGNNAALINASGAAMGLSLDDRGALSRDIFSWIWASGNDFFSGGFPPVINNRAITQDINFLGTLYRENLLAPGSFEATGEQRLEEFAQGTIAMMIASTRVIPALREIMGDEAFGITTIPGSGLGGRYRIGISSIHAGINAASAHPDAAWTFLSFLAGQNAFLSEQLKAVPGNASDLFFGDYAYTDPFYSRARDIFEAAQVVQGFSGTHSGKDYENAVWEELKLFFQTGRTTQETLTAIQRRWNEITESKLNQGDFL